MKVGIVVPFSWSFWGAVVEHAELQAAALRELGHDVRLVMGNDPPGPVLREVVSRALAEDLGVLGDVTSIACIGEDQTAVAAFAAREEGVLAGTAAVDEVYRQVDGCVAVEWRARDGESIDAGMELGRVAGPLRSLLQGERVALNLLSHCSGDAYCGVP